MPHLISFSLLPRAFRADVANTDQLNERATLEDWQVLIGDTAATDDASADAARCVLCSAQCGFQGGHREGAGREEGGFGESASGDLGGKGFRKVHGNMGISSRDSRLLPRLQGSRRVPEAMGIGAWSAADSYRGFLEGALNLLRAAPRGNRISRGFGLGFSAL